jgi:Phage integrase family
VCPRGWRDPSLNETCLAALKTLYEHASKLGFSAPDHFLFPWHGAKKEIDPSRPMTSWRSAWRSLRKAAGLSHVRFHDGRHTALTRLAEKGVPDWVIRAQFGHVSPSMMATYSHVRRKALDEAAKALEAETEQVTPPADQQPRKPDELTSQSTSQSGVRGRRCGKKLRKKVRPARLERATSWFVARRSIQLSYGRATNRPLSLT